MLFIENDGPDVIRSNYWKTELAERGLFFLSVNSRAFRLLAPRQFEAALEDMRSAHSVIVSRGHGWNAENRMRLRFCLRMTAQRPLRCGSALSKSTG